MFPPISALFKEENDPFYRKGYKKGRMESKKECVLKMRKVGLEIDIISNITGLSIEEIEKM